MPSNALVPPKRWRRRMERIGSELPEVFSLADLNEDSVDLARLTTAEQQELRRLMAQVRKVGLAGLSEDDLDHFLYIRVILDGGVDGL